MWAALINAIRSLLARRKAERTLPPVAMASASSEVPPTTKSDLRFTKVDDSLHSYRLVLSHEHYADTEIAWDFEYSQAIEAWIPWDRPWGCLNPPYYSEWCVPMGMAWDLVETLEVYAIPNFYWDGAYSNLDRAPAIVDWEYRVLSESEPGNPIDYGFVPGRSCQSHLPKEVAQVDINRRHQQKPGSMAALFRIHSYDDLVKVLAPTSGDAYGEVTLFGVLPGRGEELIAFLRSTEPPSLEALLKPGEVFVDLLFGHDLGYDDCMTIKSASNLDDSIRGLEQAYTAAITDFERRAPDIHNESEAIEALQRLAAGSPP